MDARCQERVKKLAGNRPLPEYSCSLNGRFAGCYRTVAHVSRTGPEPKKGHAAGRRRPLVPVRLPGKAFRALRAFRAGGNLAPERAVGTVTYEKYLVRRAKAGRL